MPPSKATNKKKHIVVPIRRAVKSGTRGPDALAVKRALRRQGFYDPGKKHITKLFGPFAVKALKKAQRRYGLPADGVYGPRTHREFVKRNAFDPYGALLMGSVKLHPKRSAEEDIRSRIVSMAFYCYAHRDRMDYVQRRAMTSIVWNIWFPRLPASLDCSEFRTWLSRNA